jgi:predicted phage terminase large subunit-like protein
MAKQPTFNEHELVAAICKESFADFVREFWHEIVTDDIVWNWHMDVLCGELQAVAERIFKKLPRLYDLVINVPPATTKSSICSVMFPAWLWTRMAHCRVIGASYSYSLAVDLSRKCRDIVKSEKYRRCFPGVLIREDQDAKGYFVNSKHGDRFTASVNGMVTGMHGHVIIVDDPLDPEQAFSEAELKIANRWMTHTLPSRKVDKSVAPVILVQQRLHANDPSGEMLAKSKQPGGFPVRHIRIPADDSFPVEPPELAEKYANGLMDPRRLPRVVLDAERANSEYTYRSQYGQDPQPAGGTMFQAEWFNQRVRSAPYEAQRILYVDRACLVGETLVMTDEGERPIKDVRAGDKVLTRQGYKRVKRSWLTKYTDDVVSVQFPNGRTLTGTPDHRVWTEEDGWVDLAAVACGRYTVCIARRGADTCRTNGSESAALNPAPKRCGSRGSRTTDGLAPGTSGGRGSRCTGPSGRTTTAPSPKASTCITRMKMSTTTTSATSCASAGPITTESIAPSRNGTRRHKRTRCGERTLVKGGRELRTETKSASTAENALSPATRTRSALSSARGADAGTATATACPPAPARCAACRSRAVLRREPAPSNAPTGTGAACADGAASRTEGSRSRRTFAGRAAAPTPSIPVYDLEVEDAHEFFANGVLVHNSTEGGGAYTAMVLMAKSEEGNFYVEHVVHGQWEPDKRNEKTRAEALRCRAKYHEREPVIWVEREGGSAGRDAWKGVARALAGFNIREDSVSGRKEVRAEPWAAQLSARNVFIVDDGTWDVNNYVNEHCLFPNGKFKDQVDASSGAFNLLTGMRRLQGIRVIRYSIRDKRKPLRLVVCTEGQLAALAGEGPLLVVSLGDLGHSAAPEHADVVDSMALGFPDLDPALLQDAWDTPLEAYGSLPEGVMLRKEEAKRVWAFLLKDRPAPPSSIVFCENQSTTRALSVALAVCDAFRLPRKDALICDGVEDKMTVEAPNRHVYKTFRAARAYVAR